MKKDSKTMKEVAQRCDKYCSCNSCKTCNSTATEQISCATCKHYTPDKVCNIDLYAEIVNNHNL